MAKKIQLLKSNQDLNGGVAKEVHPNQGITRLFQILKRFWKYHGFLIALVLLVFRDNALVTLTGTILTYEVWSHTETCQWTFSR